MSYHASRLLAPGASRKRKEMESPHGPTSLKPLGQQTAVSPTATSFRGGGDPKPLASNNRLLAGYMAYEFLTKGTLLGEKFDPARAEAVQLSKNKQVQDPAGTATEAEGRGQTKPHGYVEVASLLRSDGVHIPGIVNPTQLGRWIQM
ncbi:Embryo sac development arrest 6 [Dorcoceras hygrometricum]|uniref:Embryo sac development arrest 6 n=1 Tax=Dorcoceras hygrometricum TaxID=472368 RepID=A0A2Z7BIB1_9LAMI|nr:Embryo sac development arrest 6 [Dorcoceras hygrometricum]